MMPDKYELTNNIRQKAIAVGFSECGFSKVRELTEHEHVYRSWLAQDYHANMEYMERNVEKRFNPDLLVENAKTVISLLVNYYPKDHISGSPLKISSYSYGTDYHEVIKAKLMQLDQFIKDQATGVIQRCFVDSAPVLEREWAQNSGLGWIGKNSCLVSRKHGSFVFISEIITSLELAYDEPLNDYCGSCRKCVDACPTQAITEDRLINSHRCISYQTIENRNEIPCELKGKFQDFIFGCDICQDVCPWNKNAHPHSEPLFNLRKDINELTMEGWKTLDLEKYQRIFKKSAVKRTKFSGLKRNIKFVIE